MKLQFLSLTAAAAVIALGACAPTPAPASKSTTDKVYTGVLPSADTQGVRYTLLLDFDDDGTEGDYDMVQTYFNVDTVGNVADVATFASEGDFTVGTTADGKKYLKFTSDGAGELYFLAETDSTLVMTDATLTPTSTPGLNYTLKSSK